MDQILCLSVNDPYVMAEWGRNQGLHEVQLVSDGDGEFSRKMGMLLDDSEIGMGERSRRYSMLVRDGQIEKMFAEPEESGDPYSVSDADTMLDWLAPQSRRPPRIAILTKPGCPYCARAKQMLSDCGLRFEEIALNDAIRSRVLGAVTGATTAPQLFADGRLIGDSEALRRCLDELPAQGAADRKP